MALTAPKFSHPSATDVTLTKGLAFPLNQTGSIKPLQKIGKAVGGAVKVIDFGNKEVFWQVTVRNESLTNRNALLAFFADADVNYAENTFTFYAIDTTVSYTVRLWSIDGVDFPQTRTGLYNIDIVLRQEIT